MLISHQLFAYKQERTRQVGWSNQMYHVMVRQEGTWVSFGLQTPGPQWTEYLHTLQHAFTPENVYFTHWSPSDTLTEVYDVQSRMRMDVVLANEAQDDWETGNKHRDVCDENGRLNISAAIAKLRKAA